ncbi:MAG: transposase [Caldilineaceae bacterium]|nr:transposase [Caldilineaceae bacterium]
MSAFLDQIPARLRPTIRAFTTDMWDGYLNAIEEYIQAHEDVTAYLVVDRFHVAENYRDDFDSLRKTEMKRLKKELHEETYEQECKGMLWTLRKNHEDLNDDERKRLRQLFRHTPLLHQAYTLRTELTVIFNQAKTVDEAEHRLNQWIQKAERLDVACFRPFIKTLTRYWSPIVSYFEDRVNSGFVEGLNNKIKTIKRRCYGIGKTSTLFQRLWLDLAGYKSFMPNGPFALSTT